jgi:hypothetical protein
MVYCVEIDNYIRVDLYQIRLITYNSCYSYAFATVRASVSKWAQIIITGS